MKTQLFKARDMKTAMNLVNDEYGDKAIILSTKRNNGVVEVEASDNDKVIETHKKKVEEKKIFRKFSIKKSIYLPKKENQIKTMFLILEKKNPIKTFITKSIHKCLKKFRFN